MGVEWRMDLGGRALGLSALSPRRLGSRLLVSGAAWLVPGSGTLALILAQPNFISFFESPVSVPPCKWRMNYPDILFFKCGLDPVVGIELAEIVTGFGRWPTHYGSP